MGRRGVYFNSHSTGSKHKDQAPICKEASYVEGTRTSNYCTGGSRVITSEAACKAAAKALRQRYVMKGSWYTSPKGCLTSRWDRRGVFFNTHRSGRGHKDQAPICARSAEAVEDELELEMDMEMELGELDFEEEMEIADEFEFAEELETEVGEWQEFELSGDFFKYTGTGEQKPCFRSDSKHSLGKPKSLAEAKAKMLNTPACRVDGYHLMYSPYSSSWGAYCCTKRDNVVPQKNWQIHVLSLPATFEYYGTGEQKPCFANKSKHSLGKPKSLAAAKEEMLKNPECRKDGYHLMYSPYSSSWGAYCCPVHDNVVPQKNWQVHILRLGATYGPAKEIGGLKASLTSAYSNYPAQNCIDGNTNNFCHGLKGTGDTLTITLPTDVKVTQIKIYNRKSCCQGRLKGAKVSANGQLCGTISDAQSRTLYMTVNCANAPLANKVTIQTFDLLNIANVKVVGKTEVTAEDEDEFEYEIGAGGESGFFNFYTNMFIFCGVSFAAGWYLSTHNEHKYTSLLQN